MRRPRRRESWASSARSQYRDALLSTPRSWWLTEKPSPRSGTRRRAVNGSGSRSRMRHPRGRWRWRVRDGRHGRCGCHRCSRRCSRGRCDDGFRCCRGRGRQRSADSRGCDRRFGDHGHHGNHRSGDGSRERACGDLLTGGRLSGHRRLPQGERAGGRGHHARHAERCRQGLCDAMTARTSAHVVPRFCSPTPSHGSGILDGQFAPRVSQVLYRRR